MSNYYLDSSALLKYYIPEIGTTWVEQLIESEVNTIFTSLITIAEIGSTLARKSRATHDGITNLERQQLLGKFIIDCNTIFVLVPVQRPVIDLAVSLSQSYRLRGYDSVQLAAAITMKNIFVKRKNASELAFVASDKDLLLAAQSEGFLTDDPTLH